MIEETIKKDVHEVEAEVKKEVHIEIKKHPRLERMFKSEEMFLKTPVGIFLLGCFLGELSPDPTDAIHFWLQSHVLNNTAYSAGFRAAIQVFDWYFMSATWFLLLLILAYILHVKKVNTVKRISWIGGIISIGLVIGLLAQFLGA